MAIENGKLVLVKGPYPCGNSPDVPIFMHRVKLLLLTREQVVADNENPDAYCVKSNNIPDDYKGIHS